MKTSRLRIALILVLLPLGAARAQTEDPNKANLEALTAKAAAFVEAYNKSEPEALAEMFLPEGEIVLTNGAVVSGQDEIRDFYTTIFAGDNKPQAAIETDSVRFVTPSIAMEDGTLHFTSASGEVTSRNYSAVQIQQDSGAWLTASFHDETKDCAPACDKLMALSWLIGDWMVEADGSRSFVSFYWSDDGPYIDGKAVTEQPGADSTASTYRIGWNNQRKNYVSWAFDALGGFLQSDWAAAGNAWLLRSAGVTADGEINTSTQRVEPDPSHQSFLWSRRDQTLDDEIQPDIAIRVVKRPPESAVAPDTAPDDKK